MLSKFPRLASALAIATLGLANFTVWAGAQAPHDVPYPGTLKISVDATDLAHRIFRVHETIPAAAGPLTLLYPQWIPGNYAPTGPIDKLAGLVIKAGGKVLPWTRDPLDVYAFHVDVPQGATRVDVSFQYLSPQDAREGSVAMTPELLDLQWNTVTLYPAGHDVHQIRADPSVTLPAGWQAGTSLDVASKDGDTLHFKPVDYNHLIESPVYAGKYFRRVDLDPGAVAPVHMDLVADDARDLDIKPAQIQPIRNLVRQMYTLYGAPHYKHYDFLISLSANVAGAPPDFFTDWKKNILGRTRFTHEFNHAWDGKYRRGADLATPDYSTPMGGSLLWVDEGQTQFWTIVMAARSGLWDAGQARDMLAIVAATYDRGRPGLARWRNVQDTTHDPVIVRGAPLPYVNYQGNEDYYSAGLLIWLAVDGKLRELSGGRKSIDDFGKAFFGAHPGKRDVHTYTFDDVVKTLNGIAPYDWAKYLRTRLDGHGPLIGGIESHGWKLVYTDKPSAVEKMIEAQSHAADLAYSLGLTIGKGGSIDDVLWDGPAFKAGMSPGMTVIAVNGRDYDADGLERAIAAAAQDKSQPIELLVKNFDEYKTLRIDYHGGLKYPRLVRDTGEPDTLDALLKAR
ncbi:MAG: M61 family peptidase [Rhodanobacter sp.]|nr:MAG: M61 family peptidase [Rhodanobacter sp.]